MRPGQPRDWTRLAAKPQSVARGKYIHPKLTLACRRWHSPANVVGTRMTQDWRTGLFTRRPGLRGRRHMAAIFISHRSSDNADATQLKHWLADQGYKHFFLDFDPADGIPAGVDWEQTIYHHLRQCQALLIVLTPDWLASKWCFAELTLAREQGKAVFVVRTKPLQGGSVIPALQEVDLIEDRDGALAKLARGLKERGLDPRDAFDRRPERPIYPGLNAFEEEDAANFFGRSEESWRAVESLQRLRRQGRGASRLLLIAGASGSGKSSLMRAGTIPRLKKYPGQWLPIRPFRRGADAIAELGYALAWAFMQCKGTHAREITAELRAAAARADGECLRTLARELRLAAGSPEATVLIAIDQVEELLASNVKESANYLLHLLGDALSEADRELMAIATIRSDALGLWQQHPAVRGIEGRPELTFETFPLGPMPLDRIPEIIRGPARYIRLEIDDELVDAVRADVKTSDALPLLAYTLQQLHTRSGQDGGLTLPAYVQLGRLEGSIRKIADESIDLQRLSTDDREALRTAFVPTLIRATEVGGFARDRTLREQLPRRADPLVQKLVDAHLLVTDRDNQGRETVEIAHEALLQAWPTLISWLVEDRDKLRQHNAIERAAKDWDEGHRKADLLVHRDGRLTDATDLVAEKRFAFRPGSVEESYLDACVADQNAREAAAQTQRDRQLKDAQNLADEKALLAETEKKAASNLRRRAIVAAVAALAALLLLVIAIVLWRKSEAQKIEAEREAHLAQVSRLAAQASSVRRRYPQRSVLLAVEAVLAAKSFLKEQVPVAEEALRESLSGIGGRPIARAQGSIWAVANTKDRLWVVTAESEKGKPNWTLQANDLSNSRKLDLGRAQSSDVAISLDLRWLVTIGDDGSARIWDLTAAPAVRTLVPQDGGKKRVSSVAVSSDSSWIATLEDYNIVRLWHFASRSITVERIVQIRYGGPTLAISPNARWLAVSGFRNLSLYDLSVQNLSPNPIQLTPGEDFNSISFSPDGHWLVAGSGDGVLRLWDLTLQNPNSHPLLFFGHEGRVGVVTFSPDSEYLVSGGEDATARAWDLKSPDPTSSAVVFRGHEGAIRAVSISADGTLLTTGSLDGTVRVWPLKALEASADPILVSNQALGISELAISSDNHWLATGGFNGQVRLWDITTTPLATSPLLLSNADYSEEIWALAISPDSRWLATGDIEGEILLWDLHSPSPAATIKVLRGHTATVHHISFTQDGHWLVSVSSDATTRMWDLRGSEPEAHQIVLKGDSTRIYSLALSPDNLWLATGDSDGRLKLWDLMAVDHKETPLVFAAHKDRVFDIIITADSHFLITGSDDKTTRIWDLKKIRREAQPIVLEGEAAGISKDSRWLVTIYDGKTARLYDLKCKSPRTTFISLSGHESLINSVAVSNDNRLLVTASEDGTVRVWDLNSKDIARSPVVLRGHRGAIRRIDISPDNRLIATGGRDNQLRLWLLQQSDLINVARTTAGRNLKNGEWTLYFPTEPYRKTFPDLPGPEPE